MNEPAPASLMSPCVRGLSIPRRGNSVVSVYRLSDNVSEEIVSKIHDLSGQEILRQYGVATPKWRVTSDPDEAARIYQEFGGRCVVKAQIHAGGRGKGGGVKLAKSPDEAREPASKILGMQLVTHQTGPEGQLVRKVLIEETEDIARGDTYLPVLPDADGRIWSEQLGLKLGLWSGFRKGVNTTWVRLFDAQGRLIPTESEAERLQAEVERQRAEAERQRAEAERQRAEAAEAELTRLRAKLADAGG